MDIRHPLAAVFGRLTIGHLYLVAAPKTSPPQRDYQRERQYSGAD
jgi:hypothetical protein